MTADYHPLLALLLTVSGWVSLEQQRTIEHLVEENRGLRSAWGFGAGERLATAS